MKTKKNKFRKQYQSLCKQVLKSVRIKAKKICLKCDEEYIKEYLEDYGQIMIDTFNNSNQDECDFYESARYIEVFDKTGAGLSNSMWGSVNRMNYNEFEIGILIGIDDMLENFIQSLKKKGKK